MLTLEWKCNRILLLVFVILFTMAVLGSLAGCGPAVYNKPEPEKASTTTTTTKTTTLDPNGNGVVTTTTTTTAERTPGYGYNYGYYGYPVYQTHGCGWIGTRRLTFYSCW